MVDDKQKYYLIYAIVNKVNNKIYIGCHVTSDLEDGYMGSGKLIKLAIAKYGLENFNKEILIYCENIEEMFILEKNIILQLEPEYNIYEGGKGGWQNINAAQQDNEFRRLGGSATKGLRKETSQMNSPEVKARAVATLREGYKTGRIKPSFSGRTHSPETKKKMSDAKKGFVPWNKGTAIWNLPKPCVVCSVETKAGICRSCSQKRAARLRNRKYVPMAKW